MVAMRFHVIGEPHTQTTRDWANAAFTNESRLFCDAMKALGHEVYLYASEENEAACDELITCITKAEQATLIDVHGPADVARAEYREDASYWTLMNGRVIAALRSRVQPGDFICTTAGYEHRSIPQLFPQAFNVEHVVSYQGVRHDSYRVFASQAWMHTIYGWAYGSHAVRGRFTDRVIPHMIEESEFKYQADKDDYFLFVGRLNEDKGVRIAAATAAAVGVRLVVAGVGPVLPDGVDYVGRVGQAERRDLMAGARALFAPSLYMEPFGIVAIEAMLSGTPAITTDWGGFTETVIDGVSGFRCNTFQDFVDAANRVDDLDPMVVSAHAMQYTSPVVGQRYEQFFLDISQEREERDDRQER